jgi:hypothetical protein
MLVVARSAGGVAAGDSDRFAVPMAGGVRGQDAGVVLRPGAAAVEALERMSRLLAGAGLVVVSGVPGTGSRRCHGRAGGGQPRWILCGRSRLAEAALAGAGHGLSGPGS